MNSQPFPEDPWSVYNAHTFSPEVPCGRDQHRSQAQGYAYKELRVPGDNVQAKRREGETEGRRSGEKGEGNGRLRLFMFCSGRIVVLI